MSAHNTPAKASEMLNFDLAPFVQTQFDKIEKKSFAECLKQIEKERSLQVNTRYDQVIATA